MVCVAAPLCGERFFNRQQTKAVHPMRRLFGVVLATGLVLSIRGGVQAADPDAKAVLDKAIAAAGGESKLSALESKAIETKAKGSLSYGGADGDFHTRSVTQGINRFRQEFDGDIAGNQIKGVTVVDGDKGWRNFAGQSGKLEDDQLAAQKRSTYLSLAPATLLPLKGKDFTIESAKEDKVDNKPAVVLKIDGPDKKSFQLWFDKETGLPVKLVAKVSGFQGEEFTQETTYSKYKDFDGVKRATKIDTKHNGEKFINIEITDVKPLDKVDPKTFAEPPAD
jgi:hypothetical protein